MHKFTSNNQDILDSIPQSEKAIKVQDLSFDDAQMKRALGISWHLESDCLKFRVQLKNQPDTRRGVLSMLASLYDPLGLVAFFSHLQERVYFKLCVERV